jgi:dTDP-D-glucose 4,6-dehydratase
LQVLFKFYFDEPLRIHGDGSAARDYIFVEDVRKVIDIFMHADIDKVKDENSNVASEFTSSFFS